MDIKAQIGRRLAELREARGMSQHQLAKNVRITSQYVSRLEGGERVPSLELLDRLWTALGVDAGAFFAAKNGGRKQRPLPIGLAQLQGAASRLKPADLDLVLGLARRLGR